MAAFGLIVTGSVLLGCDSQSASAQPQPPTAPPTTPPTTPPATLTFSDQPLVVPSGLGGGGVDGRTLRIPDGYKISVYARVNKARFMTLAPNGDLLVSQPAQGNLVLVKAKGDGTGQASNFATGLNGAHDMAFKTINGKTYLYYSEINQVSRAEYKNGDSSMGTPSVIIANLPDASLPELRGNYGHALKNFVISGDTLYLAIASATNASPSDILANPKRGAVYRYDLDGKNPRLFAQGLRNAEGLAIEPQSGALWVAVNNRDNIPYPPGHARQGQVDPAYVDDHPPEPFTRVRDGGNYGWPYCNPNPDGGLFNMPYDRDWDNNRDGGKLDCNAIDRISVGIQAHSAPLGLSFIKTNKLEGAVTGLHGSWNRQKKTGYKVAYFPFSGGNPGLQVDLVSGFLSGDAVWGRPVDAIQDGAQGLYISDDYASAIYHLEPK
jgi:glucose/arabinose dehydrogenase